MKLSLTTLVGRPLSGRRRRRRRRVVRYIADRSGITNMTSRTLVQYVFGAEGALRGPNAQNHRRDEVLLYAFDMHGEKKARTTTWVV
jgi:phosphoserine phosphatase